MPPELILHIILVLHACAQRHTLSYWSYTGLYRDTLSHRQCMRITPTHKHAHFNKDKGPGDTEQCGVGE